LFLWEVFFFVKFKLAHLSAVVFINIVGLRSAVFVIPGCSPLRFLRLLEAASASHVGAGVAFFKSETWSHRKQVIVVIKVLFRSGAANNAHDHQDGREREEDDNGLNLPVGAYLLVKCEHHRVVSCIPPHLKARSAFLVLPAK
jgi:hypothetical protein